MLKIPDFTQPEIENIRRKANFTKEEERLFDLREQEETHERCAELLNISISTEKRLNKRMLNKILRIIGK